MDDGVLTSSLCQVERRKSKALEYSNAVLQGVVGERIGPYQLAIPLEAIPSNDGPPQRLREAGARYPAVASKWCIPPPHLHCPAAQIDPVSLAAALSRFIECCTADWPAVMQGPLTSVALSCPVLSAVDPAH